MCADSLTQSVLNWLLSLRAPQQLFDGQPPDLPDPSFSIAMRSADKALQTIEDEVRFCDYADSTRRSLIRYRCRWPPSLHHYRLPQPHQKENAESMNRPRASNLVEPIERYAVCEVVASL